MTETIDARDRSWAFSLWSLGAVLILGAVLTVWLTLGPQRALPGDQLTLKAVPFSALDGWTDDTQGEALIAWARSCGRLAQRPIDAPLHPAAPHAGRPADWRGLCDEIAIIDPMDHAALRRLLEALTVPVAVSAGRDPEGLFTGYYEPELLGSPVRTEIATTPLRGLPDDLVQVDLGAFRDDLRGRRIAGRVQDGRLQPYENRSAIEADGLGSVDRVLAWVNDPVDKFFLHIQGSGRIRFPNGGVMRVGYAGQNGHPYTAIGRTLIQEGHLTLENVSMQSIRDWLAAHPDQAQWIMDTNASYIFFRELDIADSNAGPLGAEGVPLTPGRSLAVDRSLFPYGMPMWVETAVPKPTGEDQPIRRLMIAQDTGGAIRGAVRGDVFWGFGDTAGDLAGGMKHPGRYYLLLPRELAMRAGLIPADS